MSRAAIAGFMLARNLCGGLYCRNHVMCASRMADTCIVMVPPAQPRVALGIRSGRPIGISVRGIGREGLAY